MTYTHYKQLLNLLHIKSMYTCGSGIYWHEQCWWMIMFIYIWTMTLKKISYVFVYCIDMKQFTQNVFIYYFKYTCIYWNTVTFHLADILHPWIFTQLGLHRQFIKTKGRLKLLKQCDPSPTINQIYCYYFVNSQSKSSGMPCCQA